MLQSISSITSQEAENKSTQGLTSRVLKGSFWTVLGQSLPLAVSFIATPFVIRLLGTESYGVLALINLIPAYFYFTDFGMTLASTKFSAEAFASHDTDAEAKVIRTSLLIALTVTIPLIILLILTSDLIVTDLLKIPEHLHYQAGVCLKIVAFGILFKTLIGIFNSPQLVRLQMKIYAMTSSVFSVIQLILTPIALYLGFNLIAVVAIAIASSFLQAITTSLVSRNFLKNLFGLTINKSLIKPLFFFGGNWVISSIAATVLVNSEKFILSITVSVKALAYYSIAVTLSQIVMMLSGSVIQSLVPAFSQLNSLENTHQLKQLYFRIIRLNFICLPPLLLILAVIAKPFFTIWAGAEFGRESSIPFYILLIGLFFNIVAFAPNSILTSFGKMSLLAKIYWIELVPYLGLVYLLTTQLGLIGAAIAWSIRTFVDSFVQFYMAGQISNIKESEGRLNLLPTISLYIVLVPSIFLIFMLGDYLIILLGISFISIIAYFLVVWRKVILDEEKQWAKNILSHYSGIKSRL